ncbi:MAG TPA: SIS domain-containing protein, partial [Mycobacteriales bacterium]|nr:SIS domain-containing protein [Mycobacteriales bacterium]
ALVVAGMGGSGISGDVLVAVAGPRCPVPIVVHRGHGLPGWVGAADIVCAVSCSGRTEETLSAADEAVRRGAPLVGIGAADSPLADRCLAARAAFVPVEMRVGPRATLWGLATPLLVLAGELRLLDLGADDVHLEQAARRLEQVAEACRPDREAFVNPGKALALELGGTLPLIWGAGQVGPVAAYRAACQLAENAKLPALSGALPEAHHNQVVVLDGALAGASTDADLFRDRVDDEPPVRIRLLLLDDERNDDEHRATASVELADARGVGVTRIGSEGAAPFERLASLVGLLDFASVYLALGQGIDPTPVDAIDELKQRLAVPVR